MKIKNVTINKQLEIEPWMMIVIAEGEGAREMMPLLTSGLQNITGEVMTGAFERTIASAREKFMSPVRLGIIKEDDWLAGKWTI